MDAGAIGATPKGGVCRLALSELDRQGRELVARWAARPGCTSRHRRHRQLFARREGRDPALPPVMTGSHIDTQPTGGKFDGNYGVLAGLEVVRTLNDHGVRDRGADRGLRLDQRGRLALRAGDDGLGRLRRRLHARTCAVAAADARASRCARNWQAIGRPARRRPRWPTAHPLRRLFRGPHRAGPGAGGQRRTIGVVTGALGQRWYDVVVTGQEAHAGPTPMALRRDALQAATRLMQQVVACAHRHGPHGRGTVGQVQVHPNSRNVIPGRVRFSIDLRNADDALCDAMDADIRATAARLATESGLAVEIVPVSAYPAQPFDAGCIAAVAQAAEALGHSHMRVVSGAGHDAVYLARCAPSGMIFVPCKDGISHNEIESAEPEHITAGCNVLLHAMLERAGVVG
jgi:N-carbamoyl-L-amino-acid hydrolase